MAPQYAKSSPFAVMPYWIRANNVIMEIGKAVVQDAGLIQDTSVPQL